MLLDVTPRFPFHNVCRDVVRHTKLTGKPWNISVSGFISTSHFKNNFFGNTGVSMSTPACSLFGGRVMPMSLSVRVRTFVNHVVSIFLRSSKPQMIRSYATRIVSTGAVVAYVKTDRNDAMCDEPGESVSGPLWFTSRREFTVSLRNSRTPNPAGVGLFNMAPKTVDDVLRKLYGRPRDVVIIHNASSKGCSLQGSSLCAPSN